MVKCFKKYEVCLEKFQPLLTKTKQTNKQTWFAGHPGNPAAKESGLECTSKNNDDFIVLVSGGGGRH